MLLVLLFSIPFIGICVLRPVLRRLALRNMIRRPRETTLVIFGSLLATALITGSAVIGDTLTASIRRSAFTQLGPIDEIAVASGFDSGKLVAEKLPAIAALDGVDGAMQFVVAGATVTSTDTERLTVPKAALVEIDFEIAKQFGGDPKATGIVGRTPKPGFAAIGEDVAARTRTKIGESIEVFAYGQNRRLKVDRILPRRGVAGFWTQRGQRSNNVFVAPGTVEALFAQGEVGVFAAPPSVILAVSNNGNVETGAARSDSVSAAMTKVLGGTGVGVTKVKSDLLTAADDNGKQLGQFYSLMGSFAIFAAILLLVNIFVMLAEERKSELGMLRAVGMRRSALVGAFATEGWLYALVSSAVGAFVGVLLGKGLMTIANRILNTGAEDFRLSLVFTYKLSSVQTGLSAGFMIALVTVVLTSIRNARFNIIHAIRDLNAITMRRPRKRSMYLGAVLAVLGLATFAAGVVGGDGYGIMLGPVMIALGVGPWLVRRFERDKTIVSLALFTLAWGIAGLSLALVRGADLQIPQFFLQGIVLVMSAVVVVSMKQGSIGRRASKILGNSLTVRIGLAYPLARRFRTGLLLAMFSIVIFVLVYISTFSAMFASQTDEFAANASGGYDLVVDSNPTNPISIEELRKLSGVTAAAALLPSQIEIHLADDDQPVLWLATGFDDAYAQFGGPKLKDRDDKYATDKAAYLAVANNPDLIIVNDFFGRRGPGPPATTYEVGDTVDISDPITNVRKKFTVAARSENDLLFNGGLWSIEAAREMAGARAIPWKSNVRTTDKDAAIRLRDEINREFLNRGADAKRIQTLVEETVAQQASFFSLMRVYLSLGLIVGLAGIGVVMVRAVRERRRQIGVLRALGFTDSSVRRAFIAETAFITIEATVLGVALGLVGAWSVTLSDQFGGIEFRVPFAVLGILIVGTVVAALLATASPARSASKIKPAVALRMTD